jgi:hypothetical protein
MIYLKNDTLNTVVYTASELGGLDDTSYILSIENQTNLITSEYEIQDVSLNKQRYNQSDIIVADTVTDFVVDTDFVIYEGSIVIVRNDIQIVTGASLINNGILIVIGGVVNGNYIGVTGSNLEENVVVSVDNQIEVDSLPNTLILVDIYKGYYDYKIIRALDSAVLDFGKLLVDMVNIENTEYSPEDNIKVYEPGS